MDFSCLNSYHDTIGTQTTEKICLSYLTKWTTFLGDKLFFDKRDNTEFDLLTVNETSVEPPQDDGNSLNSPRSLALEATFINHNFSQQVSGFIWNRLEQVL